MTFWPRLIPVLVWGCVAAGAAAQTSSLGARERLIKTSAPPAKLAREAPLNLPNPIYVSHAWAAAPPPQPRKFKPGDLLTIIVRERKQWKADADLETKKKFEVDSTLDAFPKFTEGGIGASTFRRGKPNLEYEYEQKFRNEGDSQRKDELITRMTGTIIDVKPNGLLVIEGRAKVVHDEEVSEITVTGLCRKEDVTADNTVLSTQIADKDLIISNAGALRDSARRGWIPKLLDGLRPF